MVQSKIKKINIKNIDTFIFDFDGVLTDNKVYLNNKGDEFVACNRGDGIGFKYLKKMKKNIYILSSEKNNVVLYRGKKLGAKVIKGIPDKVKVLKKLSILNNIELNKSMYIGNDINDYEAMNKCKYSACPSDSHPKIKKVANYVLDSSGGDGVVREILENIFKIDLLHDMYKINNK